MNRSGIERWIGRLALTAGMVVSFTACEVNVGDSAETTTTDMSFPSSTPTTGDSTSHSKPNTDTQTDNDNNSNPDDQTDDTTSPAPGVPKILSPGNGDHFTGSGAKVTILWTDAQGAEQFELVIQGLGSGGWQGLVDKTMDGFQYTYTLNGQSLTQFRWAVRSISSTGVASAFTAWSSFTWSP